MATNPKILPKPSALPTSFHSIFFPAITTLPPMELMGRTKADQ